MSCFLVCVPRVWNSLPVSIHESQSLPTFKRHLKDILFSVSPPCLEYLCLHTLILLKLWRYTSHVLTYLLTYFKICYHLFSPAVCMQHIVTETQNGSTIEFNGFFA